MFLLLPFFKLVYYIFMTYSCTSTTHLRPLWNLEPQCLISLCITMPYPNPSISIHIHRHIYIYIYPSYPSNHIYQIMSISIVRSVNIHRIHDFHHINISTNQSIYIYINICIYIYIYIYLFILPNILQRSGIFCLRRLGPRSRLSPCFELGDQSTQAPCDTQSDKTYKNIFKGSWEAIFRVTNTFGTLCDVVTKEVVA